MNEQMILTARWPSIRPLLLYLACTIGILLTSISNGQAADLQALRQQLQDQLKPILLEATMDLLSHHQNPQSAKLTMMHNDASLPSDYEIEDAELLSVQTDRPLLLKKDFMHLNRSDSNLFELPSMFTDNDHALHHRFRRQAIPTTDSPTRASDEQLAHLNDSDDLLDELESAESSTSARAIGPFPASSKSSQQSRKFSPANPPIFNPDPSHFMHSFVPGSGYDNRELVRITGISEQPLEVKIPQPPRAWKYIRFNSSDYVAVQQAQHIHIWRQEFKAGARHFAFNAGTAICALNFANADILQSLFYTRVINDEELLHLGITLHTDQGEYQLRTYELTGSACVPSLTVVLKNRPVRLVHLRSHYFSTLALLLESSTPIPFIDRPQNTKESASNVLVVYANGAKDIEPFNMNGFAYLAVAYTNGVDIFKFDEFLQRHSVYENIPLRDVRDVLAFRLGVEQHLALATNGLYQHLFTWRDGSFMRQQVLSVTKALQWIPLRVHTCREDLFIGLLRDDVSVPLLLYQWNSETNRLKLESDSVQRFLHRPLQPLPFGQATFSYNSTVFLLQPDMASGRSGMTRLIAIDTTLQHLPDPVFERQFQLSYFIRSLHSRLIDQQRALDIVQNTLQHAVNNEQPIITVRTTVQNLRSEMAMHSVNLTSIGQAHWQGTSITLKDASHDVDRMRQSLLSLRSQMIELFNDVKARAVHRRSAQLQIAGSKRFVGSVVLSALNVKHLRLNHIASSPFSALIHSLWLRDQPSTRIGGFLQFVQPPRITGNLMLQRWNGQPDPFARALSSLQPNIISTPVHFTGDLSVQKAIIFGRLNAVNVTSDLIWIRPEHAPPSPQRVIGPLHVRAPVLTINRLQTPSINHIDLINMHRSSLTTDTRQTVQNSIRVRQLRLYAPITVHRLNEFDLVKLDRSLVRADLPAQIKEAKFFSNMVWANDVRVHGPLNGLQVPQQLMSRRIPQEVTGEKYLQSMQCQNQLHIGRHINGLRYPADVVTLSMDEEVRSPVVFVEGLQADHDIQVSGLTDGLQLSKFARYMDNRQMVLFGHTHFHGPVHVRGNLHVDGLVSGQNLTDLAEQLVQRGESVFDSHGRKRFLHPLQLNSDLQVSYINSLSTDLLIDSRIDQVIQAPVQLRHANIDRMHVKDGRINQLDIVQLIQDHISLSQSGMLVGNKHFERVQIATVIKVRGHVNGLYPQRDFVFVNKIPNIPDSQQVQRVNNSAVTFLNDVYMGGDTLISDLNAFGKLSLVNITNLLRNRIALNDESSIPHSISIGDSIASHVELVQNKLLNGQNLNHLLGNWMRNDQPAVVTGRKWLADKLVLDGPTNLQYLNNMSVPFLYKTALKTQADQIITGDLVINGNLSVSGAVWTKLGINGISLQELDKDTPRLDRPAHLNGHNQFQHGLRIEGHLQAKTLNGLDLDKDVLLVRSSQPQYLSGTLKTDQLHVSGSLLSLSGLINDRKLAQIEEQAIRSDRANVLTGDLWIEQPVYASGDVRIRGSLTSVNITRLMSSALSRHGNQHLKQLHIMRQAPVTFSQLHVNKVNGISLQEFIKDVVFINRVNKPQSLGLPKQFRRVKLSGAFHLPSVHFNCPINRMNLHELFSKRLPLTSSSPVHINSTVYFVRRAYFNSGVQAEAPLNGIRLETDVLLKNGQHKSRPQLITGQWAIASTRFEQDIIINDRFNGRSISALMSETLFREGNQTISGSKYFTQPLYLNAGLNVNLLNNRTVPARQPPFATAKTIGDLPIYFQRPVVVRGALRIYGLIDGVNLTEWALNSLHKTGKQNCIGQLRTDRMRVQGDFVPGALINNKIDLISLLTKLDQLEHTVSNNSKWLKEQLLHQMQISRHLLNYVTNSNLRIKRFALEQSLPNVFGEEISSNPLAVYDRNLGLQYIQFMPNGTHGRRFQYMYKRNSSLPAANLQHYFSRQINVPDDENALLQLQLPPTGDDRAVLLQEDNRMIGTIGRNLDVVRHLQMHDGRYLVGALSGINGELAFYLLQKKTTAAALASNRLVRIGMLRVGAEATDFTMFEIEKQVYILVARSYRHSCPLGDLGSLLFRWENRRTFQLVQRIQLSDVTLVQYVQFNNNHYLLLYEADPPGDDQSMASRLHIYRHTAESRHCQFTPMQNLPAPHLNRLSAFVFGPADRLQLYVLGLSSEQLYIWRYGGHSGLYLGWSLPMADAHAVRPHLFNKDLYLIVAQDRVCTGSRIYRAVTTGSIHAPLKLYLAESSNQLGWGVREKNDFET